MLETLNAIDSFIWGPPLLILLIGTGILLTARLRLLQISKLPRALKLIFTAKNQGDGDVDSFKALCTALAATVGTGNIVGVATAVHAGGFLGATVLVAMRNGVARGVFSNESGLGSAPIVAAAAKTKWPAEQGLISMTGTFIDTIIICTLTGLVLVVSGAWMGDVNGAALTNAAFTMAFPTYGSIILCVGLTLFAFTTILGWNYYGERCVEYLVGVKGIMPYRIIFIALVACGAFIKLDVIWILADIVNGLMAIPNLIALIGLSGVVVAETKKYFDYLKEEKKDMPDDLEEEATPGH